MGHVPYAGTRVSRRQRQYTSLIWLVRHQLVPQPEPHGPPPQSPGSSGGNGNPGPGNSGGSYAGPNSTSQSGPTAGSSLVNGLGGLWGLLTGGNGQSGGNSSTSNTTGRSSTAEERMAEERRPRRERERQQWDLERSSPTRSPTGTRYNPTFPDRQRSDSSEGLVRPRSPRPYQMSRHQSSNRERSPPGAWEELD